ncbi:hypothetical protein HDU96_007174 [Phlyctochytrium bullatum]|nr:hypothetical protein HDU96_007174 [Phlyctochytrium bullatum]
MSSSDPKLPQTPLHQLRPSESVIIEEADEPDREDWESRGTSSDMEPLRRKFDSPLQGPSSPIITTRLGRKYVFDGRSRTRSPSRTRSRSRSFSRLPSAAVSDPGDPAPHQQISLSEKSLLSRPVSPSTSDDSSPEGSEVTLNKSGEKNGGKSGSDDDDDDEDEDLDKVLVPLPMYKFVLVYVSLLLCHFLAQLDTSIVATALRAIVTDLGDAPLLPWIGSAYLLTCTASAALYGKISDVFGRKPVLLFSLVVFAIGSVICSYCRNMRELIIGRAISGIGGGGISSMIYIVISDLVSLRARANYQGIVNTTAGVASVVGPLIGGILSDKASWRWCFLVNVPIGILAIAIFTCFMSFPPSNTSAMEGLRRLDWLGMFLLTACTVCIVTPLQLGGTVWMWDSPASIGMFCAGAVLLAVFVVVEWKVAKDPFMPGELFSNPGVSSLFVIAMFMGFLYFGVPYYMSQVLFFQMCYGASAIEAGVYSIPLVLGVIISSLSGSYYISISGRHLLLIYIGGVLETIGITLITFLQDSSVLVEQVVYLFVTGFGLGLVVCTRIIAVQVIVRKHLVAVATGVSQFFRLLGGTLGVAVTGTIFNNAISSAASRRYPLDMHIATMLENATDPGAARRTLNFVALRSKLPNDTLVNMLIDSFLEAFRLAYRSMLAYPLITLLLTVLFVRTQRVRGLNRLRTEKKNGDKKAGEEEEGLVGKEGKEMEAVKG